MMGNKHFSRAQSMKRLLFIISLLVIANHYVHCQKIESYLDIAGLIDINDTDLLNQSLAYEPDFSRIRKVFNKAESGKDITIGAIGGSITMGAAASAPEERWVNLVARWFQHKYPDINVYLYNAGIGATNSKFGALRAYEDLLKYNPDIVFFEFSVNDNVNDMVQEGAEGLIRQILQSGSSPGLIMLGMMNRWGDNVQELHIPLAEYYGVPFLSLRNVCAPRIANGSLEPEEILADDVHPNTVGHRLTARMIVLQLEKTCSNRTANTREVEKIPAPLYSDLLEKVSFIYASELLVSENSGWNLQEHAKTKQQHWRLHGKPIIDLVWNAKKPGAVLSFDYEGTFLALTYYQYKAGSNAGSIKIEIDGNVNEVIKAEGEQTWGGLHKTEIIGPELPAGKHKVRIELINKEKASTGSVGFDIIAVGRGLKK